LQQAALSPPGYWIVAMLLILAGGPICGEAAKQFGVKDPGGVVYDEIVAFFLVFAAVPVTLTTGVLGFVWFRLFDITKPWPARRLEHLPGGWGILADDLAAGAYAGGALWATMWVAGRF
jgi:phosphatidylglycerophosphatase A